MCAYLLSKNAVPPMERLHNGGVALPNKKRRQPREVSRKVGLARALSKLGFCSRSQAAALIRSGRVRLNGAVRRDPETPVRPGTDRLAVDGHGLVASQRLYLMLNKPRGVVTTADDEKGRDTVYSCLPAELPWLAPVGRLDKASEGLLLLTNDPEWADRVTAPQTHLEKIYHVQIGAVAGPPLLQKLEQGLATKDGDFLRASRARILRQGGRNTWLEITLEEGKSRQIRRMFEALGIAVLRLVRVAIGPLVLGNLAKGASRALRAEEKQALDEAMRN